MNMKALPTLLCLAFLSGCAGSRYLTVTGYLGIPNQEQHPGKAQPISILRGRYYGISKVELVPYDDYLWYKTRSRIRFEAWDGRTIYFSIEANVDFEIEPGGRDYVIVLERKRTTLAKGTKPGT